MYVLSIQKKTKTEIGVSVDIISVLVYFRTNRKTNSGKNSE